MKKIEKADIAFDIYSKIVEAKSAETNRVIYLGHLFKQIRDKKLFKHLDSECGSFNEFCADPNLGYQRSTVYSYIHLFEKYVEELNYDTEYLSEIGHKRLQLILPFVDKDAAEWLSRAKSWSYRDLINEIRRLRKRPPMKKEEIVSAPLSKNYVEYVKAHGCILHSGRKSLGAHFPKTRGAGAPLDEIIPLCEECELEQHRGVVSFFRKYRNQICQFYYTTIFKLCEEVNRCHKNSN